MIGLLEQAMARVQELPSSDQDAIAQLILGELADEQEWEAQFARSQDALSRLAAKVRADIQAGKTTSLFAEDHLLPGW